MSKKSYLLVVVGLVVIIVAIYFLISSQNAKKNLAPENQIKNEKVVPASLEIPKTPSAYAPKADLIYQETQTLKVEANNFAPRELNAKSGAKVTLILSATDEATHKIVFVDAALSYIDLTFSKTGGDKTITFPAPKAGLYNFYIDEEGNKGALNVGEF